jgi:mannose-6-phosphate isomerase-like protein (cupin superfamily)
MLDTTSPATGTAVRRISNPVQQDGAVFVETVAESGGVRTLVEIDVSPGGGNMPHRHLSYAEHFEVLEGTLTVRVGRAERRLGPGEKATAPANTTHCFRNETDTTVRFLVTLDPGHRGMEQALQIGYGLAADGLVHDDGTPKDLRVGGLLAELADIRIDGPKRVLNPLVGLLARMARRRGLDRELQARYVRY